MIVQKAIGMKVGPIRTSAANIVCSFGGLWSAAELAPSVIVHLFDQMPSWRSFSSRGFCWPSNRLSGEVRCFRLHLNSPRLQLENKGHLEIAKSQLTMVCFCQWTLSCVALKSTNAFMAQMSSSQKKIFFHHLVDFLWWNP